MRATSGPLRKRHPWELRDVTVDDDELTTRVRAALSAGCEARADQRKAEVMRLFLGFLLSRGA